MMTPPHARAEEIVLAALKPSLATSPHDQRVASHLVARAPRRLEIVGKRSVQERANAADLADRCTLYAERQTPSQFVQDRGDHDGIDCRGRLAGVPISATVLSVGGGLIRFRGHFPKGGYDVHDGSRHPEAPNDRKGSPRDSGYR
jgi:hypothetical protein